MKKRKRTTWKETEQQGEKQEEKYQQVNYFLLTN